MSTLMKSLFESLVDHFSPTQMLGHASRDASLLIHFIHLISFPVILCSMFRALSTSTVNRLISFHFISFLVTTCAHNEKPVKMLQLLRRTLISFP